MTNREHAKRLAAELDHTARMGGLISVEYLASEIEKVIDRAVEEAVSSSISEYKDDAAAAVKAEREACAKIIDIDAKDGGFNRRQWARRAAKRIRARGDS